LTLDWLTLDWLTLDWLTLDWLTLDWLTLDWLTLDWFSLLTLDCLVRLGLRALEKDFDKSENDLKALQSVGQIIGEVLKQLDDERCELSSCCVHLILITVIVKASSGPRYVVGCRNKVPKDKLISGVRVSLDMTTLTIMRILPREVIMRSIFTALTLSG
jgi:hypothetical protein